MTHIIASGRVYLRPFEAADAEIYRRWRADAEPMALAGWHERAPLSLAQVEKRIAGLTDDQGKEVALYSKRRGKAAEPLTAEEWATEIAPLDQAIADFYKESQGGGAKNQRPSSTADGRRLIANDPATLSANIEAIANGKAVVAAP